MSAPKPKRTRKYSEAEAIAALKRIAERWPVSLWLYSQSGTLSVMRKKDGINRDEADRDDEVCTIDIENDGGDY